MPKDRKRIGEIFVNNGTITEITLQRALDRSTKQRGKLGYILEDMGVVTGDEIAQALASQYGYKRVRNLVKFKLTDDLLNLVTVETAFRYMLFPLKIKKNKLYIAIADPTDTKIISNISINHNLEVIPFVATRSDIIAAITKNFLGKDMLLSKRKTILVAADNSEVHADIEHALSSKGYRVLIARDGIQAFKMVLSESPCVVITEKTLPKLDGYRLIEAIKNLPETRYVPVILVDDGSYNEEELIAHNHGFFEYITTPINPVSLITRVKKAVHLYDTKVSHHLSW
ncbi:MAG TPA: response regulator [Geobacteraceae bacterium]|nr:response regulator [Geobacteraceae bacterium]